MQIHDINTVPWKLNTEATLFHRQNKVCEIFESVVLIKNSHHNPEFGMKNSGNCSHRGGRRAEQKALHPSNPHGSLIMALRSCSWLSRASLYRPLPAAQPHCSRAGPGGSAGMKPLQGALARSNDG